MPQNFTRRDFLRGASRLALALGVFGVAGCSGGADLTTGADSGLPWDELARSLQGPLLRPGMPDFEQIAAPWNLRYASRMPGAIARCSSPADVQASLEWATSNHVPLVARSGGHSYAGYSTTPGLMIDVSPMNSVAFDPATGQATLGGGARNRDAYAAMRPLSVAVTHGRCKGVGVAGLVLGGGIGFNMRAHGLTCDQLLSTDVVLPTGELVTCNAESHPDLFWACRGAGGGNFGIHTSFTFQTFPVGDLTVYQITWETALDDVLPKLFEVLDSAPDRMGCKVSVPAGQVQVVLLGQLVGTAAELRQLLDPVYAMAAPSQETIQETTYWDGQEFLSEIGPPEFSHERSRYAFAPLGRAATDTILQHVRAWPGTSVGASWKMFLTGGAIDDLASDATAYVHRGARMVTSIELEWGAGDSPETVAANAAWLNDFHGVMEPFTSDESYQNFIDDDQADYLQAYYGANLPRLVEVKRRYDPTNVFHYPQSILVTG